ncbi:MAG TPA: hypothetical protein VKD67_06900 [Acidimicrobiales bacterium]|nr:hypothetical protein [Acidimicrobiales bacterium]
MRPALRRATLGMLLAASGLVVVGAGATAAAAQTTNPPPAATSAASSAPAGATTSAPATGDARSSRTVNRIVLALLSLAGLLTILGFWLWRTTKPKPVYLDGLDAMGSRRWRSATPERRAAILAPVHERRGEIRDEDLVAEPELELEPVAEAEPAPEPVPAADAEPEPEPAGGAESDVDPDPDPEVDPGAEPEVDLGRELAPPFAPPEASAPIQLPPL